MKNFNLIGENTSKSLSPYIHNFVFNEMGINATYKAISMRDASHFKTIIQNIKLGEIGGINITNPYKINVIEYLDKLDQSASVIGAVNCVSLKEGSIYGHNTDWFGFKQMLLGSKINFDDKNIKIIGYGGAALAVKYAFEIMGVKKIEFYNRKNIGFNLLELPDTLDDQSMVINATPYHFIENDLEILEKFKTTKLVWIDLLYTKLSTLKYKELDKNRYFYGLDMLIYQALASIDIWFRKDISKSVDLNDLKLYLKEVVDA